MTTTAAHAPRAALALTALAALSLAAPGDAAAQGPPDTFDPRLEATAVIPLTILTSEACEQDGDAVGCSDAVTALPGVGLQFRWRMIENFSVGLGTGLTVNPGQPLPKERDLDLGRGVWLWRSVLEPRAHLKPDPIIDFWLGAQFGLTQVFWEDTTSGKNKTKGAGALTYGGGLGVDIEFTDRFMLGVATQIYANGQPGDEPPRLRTGGQAFSVSDDALWVELGLRVTTILPL